MKIAVLSDIHGNHVAFRKCIEYIKEQNINHCILLGDYIGEFLYPQKTMELLYYLKATKECIFISGNKEDYWRWYREDGETGWQDYHSVTGCMYYGYHNLRSEDIDFMLGMEKTATCRWVEDKSLHLLHEPAYKELCSEEVKNASKYSTSVSANQNIVLCGHRHVQGQIDYEGVCYIDPGSVGVPFYSEGRTQFAIMEDCTDGWLIEYISLDYDKDIVLQEMLDEKMDLHAPCWNKMTRAILLKDAPPHTVGLFRAMQLTKEKFGACEWPNVDEECFEEALRQIGEEYGIRYE